VRLTVGPDDKLNMRQTILLGLQHLLAMDIYVQPFVIASILGLASAQTSGLIRSTFLAAGIATLIQAGLLMKLPVAQGPSYIPIAAVTGIAIASGGGLEGWGTVAGACLVGSITVILLGVSKLFHKFIRTFVPRIVGGAIIFCVGLSLMPVAVGDILNGPRGTLGQKIFLGTLTAATMVGLAVLGDHLRKGGRVFRIASVIMALVVGCLAAAVMGLMDVSPVAQADWFALPLLPFVDFNFNFDISAIVTMIILCMVLLAETTGTWLTVSNVTGQTLDDARLNRGVVGEGLGSVTASLFGATPVISYSTNAGIIAITGIAARRVFLAVGCLFIMFSLSGKLSALIATIPAPVIGGVFAIVCGVISMAGMRVLHEETLGQKETFVVAIPILMVIASSMLTLMGLTVGAPSPVNMEAAQARADALNTLPSILFFLTTSPIAVASIVAIVLNKIIPDDKPWEPEFEPETEPESERILS